MKNQNIKTIIQFILLRVTICRKLRQKNGVVNFSPLAMSENCTIFKKQAQSKHFFHWNNSIVGFLLLFLCHFFVFCQGNAFHRQFGDDVEKMTSDEVGVAVDLVNLTLNKEEVKAQIFVMLTQPDQTSDNLGLIEKLSIAFNKDNPEASELIVLKDILDMINTTPLDDKSKAELLVDILQGAHVHIIDDGVFYGKWSQMNARARISSHNAKADSIQYGISGPWIHEILFGIVDSENGDSTFFQLENSPYGREILNSIRHVVDYLKYRVSGKNQGPYGASEHKDNNPILFDKDGNIHDIKEE